MLKYSSLNGSKKGPKGPQKLSSLKSLKIQNPPSIPGFSLMEPSEFFSSYQILDGKIVERPNRSKNNGDIFKKAKRSLCVNE